MSSRSDVSDMAAAIRQYVNATYTDSFVVQGAGVAQSLQLVSDYGLGERGSIPGRGKGFFL
jgi:hypothetical protein